MSLDKAATKIALVLFNRPGSYTWAVNAGGICLFVGVHLMCVNYMLLYVCARTRGEVFS